MINLQSADKSRRRRVDTGALFKGAGARVVAGGFAGKEDRDEED